MCSSSTCGKRSCRLPCRAGAVLQAMATARLPSAASRPSACSIGSSGWCAPLTSETSAPVRSGTGTCASQCSGKDWSRTGSPPRPPRARFCGAQACTKSRTKSAPAAGPMPPRMPTTRVAAAMSFLFARTESGRRLVAEGLEVLFQLIVHRQVQRHVLRRNRLHEPLGVELLELAALHHADEGVVHQFL